MKPGIYIPYLLFSLLHRHICVFFHELIKARQLMNYFEEISLPGVNIFFLSIHAPTCPKGRTDKTTISGSLYIFLFINSFVYGNLNPKKQNHQIR